jgi:hypothetical protein
MATFTFPGDGVQEYDRAYKLFAEWLHKFGRTWFGVYLAVGELHPDGHGWHWHLLHPVDRRLNKEELYAMRQSWTDFVGRRGLTPGEGASVVRVRLDYMKSARVAGRYAGKYVSKGFGEAGGVAAGRQRYLRSNDLAPPPQEDAGYCDSLDEARRVLVDYGCDRLLDGRLAGFGLFVWGGCG